MLIETEKLLARRTRLSCLFYLPDTRKIQASGAIVRTIEQTPGDDEYQYGFMFTDMTPEDKRALSDFIGHSSIKSRLAGP